MINAYILGKIEPNAEKKVVENLKAIGGVKRAEITFGQYDFVVRIEAKDEHQLKDIIIEKVRTLPGIASTLTLISNNFAS